ncbi:MAG: T9SS type A sorting domain-containing protein, partial [Chitinophagaceae bacterium]
LKLNSINTSPKITDLTGISNFVNLVDFQCQDNDIVNFDATAFPNLERLALTKNNLTSLDVSGLVSLAYLGCGDNALTSLNLSGLSALEDLGCQAPNAIANLNLTGCASMKLLNVMGNPVGNIDFSQMPLLESMYVGYCGLTSIDLSGLTSLKVLQASSNEFPSLVLTGLTSLEEVVVFDGGIQTLEAHDLPNVFNLNITGNPLTTVSLANLPALVNLDCSYANLSQLDLTGGLPLLTDLNIKNNTLSAIDLSQLPSLVQIYAENNLLETIDLSHNTNIMFVRCEDNQLESINAKNGQDEDLYLSGNSQTLRYICADESQIAYLLANAVVSEITDCEINTYCSFAPGGEFYAVTGTNKLDIANDGCDQEDPVYPGMKFAIAGTESGFFISNLSGSYALPLPAGTHTVSPLLENPAYFNVSPASVTVTFPDSEASLQQNFCVAGNGSHPDLEVTVIPLNAARPGFDADYKVLIRNKGNIAQSGSLSVSFDGNIADLISATPAVNIETSNTLTWNFTNLGLYQEQEFLFSLNLNSPMETPALNAGTNLNFTAQLSGSFPDDTPLDNTFALSQLVVNSFDPNDKTCLEGTVVGPDAVGKFVHYVIRFENTGTANAENIVVKDIIDTTKYDVNSLVPLDGSHPFYTRVTNTNRVEFVFENINLPFEDAINDGYVAFKIKTLPSLEVGDAFSNTASIYFDYNFPIITDPASTLIQELGVAENNPDRQLVVYPNPANDRIFLSDFANLSSVEVYSITGQLLLTVTHPTASGVDVSGFKSGHYLLKTYSHGEPSIGKFIKK